MKALASLIAFLMVPLALLNWLGGLVSGVWLAFLGVWWAVGVGILAIFFSHFVLGIAFLGSFIFAAPAAYFFRRRSKPGMLLLLVLGQAYTAGVITVWCLFIMHFFVRASLPETLLPLLIWSYGVATGPIAYLAQKEQQGGGGEAASASTFFAQVAYLTTGALVYYQPTVSIGTALLLFAGVMVTGAIVQIAVAVSAGLTPPVAADDEVGWPA